MKKTFQIPSEFSDEDKWFYFFTKKSMLALIVCGGLAYGMAKFTGMFGSMWPGLIVGGIITLIVVGATMITVPDTEYLKGAGLSIDIILLRIFIRKKKKYIYIKGYDSH